MVTIEIDADSGFCFGVVTAIEKAEAALSSGEPLYCLGDIVHNSDEVERLRKKGLHTISHADIATIPHGSRLLFRAHGEPPSTYFQAEKGNLQLTDATCPVVLKLQQRIKNSYDTYGNTRQIVIYGKEGHAEVNGLVGQTNSTAIVIGKIADLDVIDFSRPVELYSQTTQSLEGFRQMAEEIASRMTDGVEFKYYDTICRQVASRAQKLRAFASTHDVVLLVSGLKSSNGRYLYEQCLDVNPNTHLIPNEQAVDIRWFKNAETIGICGATSTPRWLMEQVRNHIDNILNL